MKLFIPITKVDAQKREVYGRMVQEVPDSAGEIFDYASSKPYFEAWSEKFSKATDGKSLGNVRAMHQPIAAGKLTQMEFEDADKAIDICAKVVDDAEWDKVDQGLYTGFSIGGDYVKRWTDGTLKRYTANPKEVSLVDSPAVPTATFSMIKADGSTEERKFKMTKQTQVAAVDVLADMLDKGEITPERLVELAKADKPAKTEAPTRDQMVEVLTKRFGGDSVAKLSDEEIGKKYSTALEEDQKAEAVKKAEAEAELKKKTETEAVEKTKAEELAKQKVGQSEAEKVAAHNARIETKARELCKAEQGADAKWQDFVATAIREIKKADEAAPAPAAVVAPAQDAAAVVDPKAVAEVGKTDTAGALKKGLWGVQDLAGVLMALAGCAMSAQSEADWEGDKSMVPAQLKAAAVAVGQALKDMTAEEVDELIEGMGGIIQPVLMMADKIGAMSKADLAKAGARHSKADLARVQKIHDAASELGAKCDKDDDGGDVENAMPGGRLKKALDALSKVDELTKMVTDLTDRLKKVEDMPMPAKGALRVVGKDDEARGDEPQIKKVVSTPGQHNPDAALALIKESVIATSGARRF